MALVVFGAHPSLLLKATVLKEVLIPGYTKADGTFVAPHMAKVHVNPDVDQAAVLSGAGSHSQRLALRRLQKKAGWSDLSPDHQYAHVLRHATELQQRASAAAKQSRAKKAAAQPTAAPPKPEPAPHEALPPAVAKVAASNQAPPALALSEAEVHAIKGFMAQVEVPSGVAKLSQSATNLGTRRRIAQLQKLAAAGDLDGITNFATSRTRHNYALVDDYRHDLLIAGHAGRESVLNAPPATTAPAAKPAPAAPQPAKSATSLPEPPAITGANMQNTALLSAQRKVKALYQAAHSADPVAAVMAINTSRGNGYQNRADDYKFLLLSHLGAGVKPATDSKQAVPKTAAPKSAAPKSAVTTATAPQAQPAKKTDGPKIYTLDDDKDYKTFQFRRGQGTTWLAYDSELPNAGWWQIKYATLLDRLNKKYPASLEDDVTDADTPATSDVAETKAAMAKARTAASAHLDKLAAQPDIHKPKNKPGHNIDSVFDHKEIGEYAAKFNISPKDFLQSLQGIVADYGNNVKFECGFAPYEDGYKGRESVVTFNGDDNTDIRIHYTYYEKFDGTKELVAYLSMFQAGQQGKGSAKSVLRNSIAVMKKLGISKCELQANMDVGGYAWAKFGFLPHQEDWDRERKDMLEKTKTIKMSATARKKVTQILNDQDPRAMHVLSDMKDGEFSVGKHLLLGSDWNGVLDLNDKASYRRFLGYVAG